MAEDTRAKEAGDGNAAKVNGGEEAQHALERLSLIDDLRRVLKDGDTFAVLDRWGDLRAGTSGEHGLYHHGTRHLSRLTFRIQGRRPALLTSTIARNNALLVAELTNPALEECDLPREVLHISRRHFLSGGRLYGRIRITSYARKPGELSAWITFDADWADIFEVRGLRRPRRGETLRPGARETAVRLGYRGLDGRTRRTRIDFSPPPDRLQGDRALYRLALEPHAELLLEFVVTCSAEAKGEAAVPEPGGDGSEAPASGEWAPALARAESSLGERRREFAGLYSANELFNDWANRSADDLCQLLTEVPEGGLYPYAGIPWYSTPFGRDGIITALECLWLAPGPARGVLAYLAATQATEVDPERDAEPGKVIHEVRDGEMAALGEIPFARYYGSVDATPLFVVLAGAYYRRTGDLAFIESILPALEAAVAWLDDRGDVDGDGFVEYRRKSPGGLVNQGWKDSWDSVFHADGRLPEGPVALVEVQGYAYEAKRRLAELYRKLERNGRARELDEAAAELRTRFEERFWSEELGCYILGLDGAKEPLRVRASNAGHALFSRIAAPDRAARVAKLLMSSEFFSGWGIRTLGAGQARFNPMSYHNGSVWPHDNALISLGLSRYGFGPESLKILRGMFEFSLHLDQRRMPELFCGFTRRPEEGPSHYPEANVPQAWAASAVFLLLQAALGLRIDAPGRRVTFSRPALPAFLKEIRITGLRVGEARLDLLLSRHRRNVGVQVLRRQGEVEVRVVS